MRRRLLPLLVALPVAVGLVVAPAAGSAAEPPPDGGADALAASAELASWKPGVRPAQRYAKRRRGEVRFAIVDPGGRMHRFHAGRTAPAASVFKAMLLAAYLRQGSVDHRALNRDDKRLLAPMIRRSDNETATRVRDIVGRAAIEQLARKAQMHHFSYNDVWGLSLTAPSDQARFFHDYERFVPERHEGYARRLLSGIVPSQRWGVGQVRPDGWKLFFKGGWGTGSGRVNHQVAFLERHGRRVSLAVFTEHSPSHAYGSRTLEGVSKRLLEGLPRF